SRATEATCINDLLVAMQDDVDPETRDRLVYRFAMLSSTDRDASRVMLQVVRPGLVSIAQRYRPRWGWDETASMTVAAAFERIVTYPPGRRERPAANIVRDVQNRLHRARVREEDFEAKLGQRSCANELAALPAAER